MLYDSLVGFTRFFELKAEVDYILFTKFRRGWFLVISHLCLISDFSNSDLTPFYNDTLLLPTQHHSFFRNLPSLSMLSPRGGGGGEPRAYMRHLTCLVLPTLGNLTKNLSPRVGTFAIFARRNRTKSHHPTCSSLCSTAIKALKDGTLFLMEASTCFYIYTKILLVATHFQYYSNGTPYFVGIVCIVDDMDSLFVRESSVWKSIKYFLSIDWMGDI